MHIWNLTDELIPSPVRDIAGICGLAALGAAAAVIVVVSWAAWRHPAGTADNSASEPFPRARRAVRSLSMLGAVLLVIWSFPRVSDITPTYPPPLPGGISWGT